MAILASAAVTGIDISDGFIELARDGPSADRGALV
jgi:hypothetical protein